MLALLAAGCTQPAPALDIWHVHGLAYDSTSGALFMATHHGLVRGDIAGKNWHWDFASAERYDYMGFTQDAAQPGTFYSSGHPDNPYTYGGTRLGLRRSSDGGQTWEQRSLKGQTDFHALTSQPSGIGRLAGYWNGVVMESRDGGATWSNQTAPPYEVLALAASASGLWAGTVHGLQRQANGTWVEASHGRFQGPITALAVSGDASLLFVSTGDGSGGSVYRSQDQGATWQQFAIGALRDSKEPVLFAIDATNSSHDFAATSEGAVYETMDAGATWSSIRHA
jgi:photosystem II stability/assembly factor-like uncharacterized protein